MRATRRLQESVVLQPAMGSYRQYLLEALEGQSNLVFLVGDRHFVPTVTTAVQSPLVKSTGYNRYVLNRRLGWQRGVWNRSIQCASLMVELNPRNVNTWPLLILRRFLPGRRTSVWGHVWPRAGAESITAKLRLILCRLADGVLVYTEDQARQLRAALPSTRTFVAYNSLYPHRFLNAGDEVINSNHFVWIGRMVPDKDPILALNAFADYARLHAPQATLTMFGAGPDEDSVRRHVAELGVEDRVKLRGWVSDPAELKPEFNRAAACISSGYVGLNVTQSLGFGCPVIWPDGLAHAPEQVLLTEFNSISFPANDRTALVRAMETAADATFNRARIAADVAAVYASERMAEGLLACLRG